MVLIALQVDNSSKKRKVRLRLAPLDAISECGQLPDAGELPDTSSITLPENLPDDFKLLSLADKTAENSLKRRLLSPTASLDEFDDTPEEFTRPPLAIGGIQLEVAPGKQPAYTLRTHLARHGYRQPSVIPESEEDDSMGDQQHPTQGPDRLLQQLPPQRPYTPQQLP